MADKIMLIKWCELAATHQMTHEIKPLLKSSCSLRDIKQQISLSGIQVNAKSWRAFIESMNLIVVSATQYHEEIQKVADKSFDLKSLGAFTEVKRQLSVWFGFGVVAKDWSVLSCKAHHTANSLLLIISYKTWNNEAAVTKVSFERKRQFFEQHKFQSFVDSSRLEGVEVYPVQDTLEALKEKYKALGVVHKHG